MKKRTKIILLALVLLIGAGIGAAAWQWNNISALRYGLTMDNDALDHKIQENKAGLDEAMDRYQVDKYELTQDELAQLTDGSLSAQEVAQKLLESRQTPQGSAPEQAGTPQPAASASGSAAGSSSAQLSAEEQEIQQLIATMYVLQATYEGKLEAAVQSAIDEYTAGEHTAENRTRVVYDRIEQLLAMEKECDGQVAEVVSRLRELLKATGQSDDLAKQVEATYQQEKSLKKAYYINAFRKG